MKDNNYPSHKDYGVIEHKPNKKGYETYGQATYIHGRQVRLQELINSLANKRHEYELLVSNVIIKGKKIKEAERQIKELKEIIEG